LSTWRNSSRLGCVAPQIFKWFQKIRRRSLRGFAPAMAPQVMSRPPRARQAKLFPQSAPPMQSTTRSTPCLAVRRLTSLAKSTFWSLIVSSNPSALALASFSSFAELTMSRAPTDAAMCRSRSTATATVASTCACRRPRRRCRCRRRSGLRRRLGLRRRPRRARRQHPGRRHHDRKSRCPLRWPGYSIFKSSTSRSTS